MNVKNGFRHKGGVFELHQRLLQALGALHEHSLCLAQRKIISASFDKAIYDRLAQVLGQEGLSDVLLDIVIEEVLPVAKDEGKVNLLRSCIESTLSENTVSLDVAEVIEKSRNETKSLHQAVAQGDRHHPLDFSIGAVLYPISKTVTLGSLLTRSKTLSKSTIGQVRARSWSASSAKEKGEEESSYLLRAKEWACADRAYFRPKGKHGLSLPMLPLFDLSSNKIISENHQVAAQMLEQSNNGLKLSLYTAARQALAFLVENLLHESIMKKDPRTMRAVAVCRPEDLVFRQIAGAETSSVGQLLMEYVSTPANIEFNSSRATATTEPFLPVINEKAYTHA